MGAMTKGAIADALATTCELKKSVCAKLINSLAELAAAEVTKAGVFTLPGLCKLKTRTKPATKAGKREVFGKVVMVKAKPARTASKPPWQRRMPEAQLTVRGSAAGWVGKQAGFCRGLRVLWTIPAQSLYVLAVPLT